MSRFVRIASGFRAVFFDQYGVLHDGRRPYPGAREALAALKARGVKIVVLSNSGRAGKANQRRMAALGLGPELYDFLLTSGDVARRLMKSAPMAARLGLEARAFVVSSDGRDELSAELGLLPASNSSEADLVIIAGSQADRISLDGYRKLLAPAAERGAPCVCFNPDRLMLTAAGAAPGAGRIAELYQELGGEVTWIGKPFPEIYRAAAELAGVEDPRDILCVGDSVEHDIAGANGFGAFAALVRTGILAGFSREELAGEIGRRRAVPDYVVESLAS
ncbi:MAG TPA: TIGR01459 family HAD-type hydrolase [Roseiarcus sp.]|nr:TIGR01459 family HAD-type hydrolase [Roseiarcus sp.]